MGSDSPVPSHSTLCFSLEVVIHLCFFVSRPSLPGSLLHPLPEMSPAFLTPLDRVTHTDSQPPEHHVPVLIAACHLVSSLRAHCGAN